MKSVLETVEAFLDAWSRANWDELETLTSESWLMTVTDGAEALEGLLGSRRPTKTTVVSGPIDHSHTLTEWVIEVSHLDQDDLGEDRLTPGGPYKLMCILERRWGVNPISTYTRIAG